MRALHRAQTILTLRHAPSWLLLCFAAGCVNAISLLACERFVTHVTGTATLLGIEAAHFWLAFDFALVLSAFVFGATFAVLVMDIRARRGKRPMYALPLFLVSALLVAVAIVGHYGGFGPFGQTVDEPVDFVLLSILAFAMGIQNGAVATSTGLMVRTTHLTGPATDLGMHLAELVTSRGEMRKLAARSAALRIGKIVSFIVGAAAGVPLAHAFGFVGFVVPAGLVALANVLSFFNVLDHEHEEHDPKPKAHTLSGRF
jgi:uncharacterized membrane protein YoaK (UPF0700 family)